MIKTAIPLILLFTAHYSNAQTFPSDTLPGADSAIAAIKSDVRENLPTIIIDDDDTGDGDAAVVSSILTAGRDPFLSAAAFNFSPARFRLRGYETGGNAVYINGIDFSGLDNGFTPFGLWSGLNNVMRNQQNIYGIAATDFAFGSLALNTNTDMRAGSQRAQTQMSYALSNRNYTHRTAFSHASGFNKKGWAYSMALTGRYASEGYVPGTYYRGLSYYLGLDRKIKDKQVVSLITFGAPTEAGRQAASVQEAMDLAGTHYYNPSWGYQDGKKRNANVLQTFQPVFLLSHDYTMSSKSRLTTTAAYVFGKRKNTALDWYNAPDPRPDYYRYLPSYYDSTNPNTAAGLRALYKSDPAKLQIDWDNFFDVNRSNTRMITDANGITGNNVTGARSLYILSNRVNDQRRFIANTVLNTKLNDKITFTAGASYQQQVHHFYQEVKDLLGGDFWVNINQFAERDFPNDPDAVQYDLDHPDRIVKTGDKYGYDYRMTISQAAVWTQAAITLHYFDLFAAAELSRASFYRTGLNRNGLFPNNSFGKAAKQDFTNPSVKGGVTYKLNGRNYFFIHGTYRTNAPFFENAYISQRTRNTVQDNLKSESIISGEAGYKLHAPRLRIEISVYYTRSMNGVDVLTFYHDQYQNFVNYALSGIDKVFYGAEIGTEIKLTSTLSFNGAASMGRYYYNSRQQAMVTVDNSAEILSKQTIYLKNYRIPSTPQNAYSGGFFYRSPKYWYISLTGNYFNNMWLSLNPLRRTVEATLDIDPEDPSALQKKNAMLAQEKFDGRFTLDFFGGWSKLLPKKYNIHHKRTYLIFNVGTNNLLNNRNIQSGGFEQLRFDFEDKNVNRFPPKYYYAYGINFFASIGWRF
ncbi:MAG: TonB-dependent receptor [Niabella sp.]